MNEILLLWVLAVLALAVGMAAIYLAIIEAVPLAWLYWHARLRKPILWAIVLVGALLVWTGIHDGAPVGRLLLPFALQALGLLMGYRVHQEVVFDAVMFPPRTTDLDASPVDDMEVALLEVDGDLRAYPLAYVEHHHIVNDRFGSGPDARIIALTFCAMCRTIIAFDVTDIGPLYVASYKNGNMVVGDRKTRTFFQQATFKSVIGPRHPHTLTFYPSQILPWGAAKRLNPPPSIVAVTPHDLRRFELPIPGLWQRILHSEVTPGLSAASRDRRFPARTRVLGITLSGREWVYRKQAVIDRGSVTNREGDFCLIATGDTVTGFRTTLGDQVDQPLRLVPHDADKILDEAGGTMWDRRGRYLSGPRHADLTPVPVSDEFWFAWSRFHPNAKLVTLDGVESKPPAAAPVLQV